VKHTHLRVRPHQARSGSVSGWIVPSGQIEVDCELHAVVSAVRDQTGLGLGKLRLRMLELGHLVPHESGVDPGRPSWELQTDSE